MQNKETKPAASSVGSSSADPEGGSAPAIATAPVGTRTRGQQGKRARGHQLGRGIAINVNTCFLEGINWVWESL